VCSFSSCFIFVEWCMAMYGNGFQSSGGTMPINDWLVRLTKSY
jgi:hypothetical protein